MTNGTLQNDTRKTRKENSNTNKHRAILEPSSRVLYNRRIQERGKTFAWPDFIPLLNLVLGMVVVGVGTLAERRGHSFWVLEVEALV